MKNISFEWIIFQETFHALYFVASTRLCWYDFCIHWRKRRVSTPHSHNWNSLMTWSCVAITAQCPFGRHCVWHNVWYGSFVQTVSFVIIVECQSIAACDQDFWKGHEKNLCVFQDTAHYLVPILLEFGVCAKCPMGKPCEKPSQPNTARFLCILSMLSSVHLCALASICDCCNRTWSYLTDLDVNSMVSRGDSTHVVLLCGTVAWRIVQCTTNWCSAKVLKLLTNFYHIVINRGRSLGWVFLSRNHQNHDFSMEFVRLECAGAWRLRSMANIECWNTASVSATKVANLPWSGEKAECHSSLAFWVDFMSDSIHGTGTILMFCMIGAGEGATLSWAGIWLVVARTAFIVIVALHELLTWCAYWNNNIIVRLFACHESYAWMPGDLT